MGYLADVIKRDPNPVKSAVVRRIVVRALPRIERVVEEGVERLGGGGVADRVGEDPVLSHISVDGIRHLSYMRREGVDRDAIHPVLDTPREDGRGVAEDVLMEMLGRDLVRDEAAWLNPW